MMQEVHNTIRYYCLLHIRFWIRQNCEIISLLMSPISVQFGSSAKYRIEWKWYGKSIDEVIIIVTIVIRPPAIVSLASSVCCFTCASRRRYELNIRHLVGIIITLPSYGFSFEVSCFIHNRSSFGRYRSHIWLYPECAICLHAVVEQSLADFVFSRLHNSWRRIHGENLNVCSDGPHRM